MCDCVCLSLCYEFTITPLRAFTLLVEKWEEVPGTHCLCVCEIPLAICILFHSGADPRIEERGREEKECRLVHVYIGHSWVYAMCTAL